MSKCINTECFLNGSLSRHSQIEFNYSEPESGCRKFSENEFDKCACYKPEVAKDADN